MARIKKIMKLDEDVKVFMNCNVVSVCSNCSVVCLKSLLLVGNWVMRDDMFLSDVAYQ